MSRGNLYAFLGLAAGATGDQIDQAFRALSELYRDEALATYSLIDVVEARQLRAQVREAYEVLRDPLRRLEYDVRHGCMPGPVVEGERPAARPTPLPEATAGRDEDRALATATVPEPSSALAEPPVAEQARSERLEQVVLQEPVTGAALRAFRETRGVGLREISTATKISLRYLEYIEGDRFECLPVPVYLRGFVQEYARAAGLDPRRTAEAYLAYVSLNGSGPKTA